MPQILTTAEPVPPVLFLCASRSPPLFSFSKLTPSRSRSSSFKIKPCCQKMFVPGFGEASPEAKAATNLLNFFTFLAVKIVLAQLEVPISNRSQFARFPNPSFFFQVRDLLHMLLVNAIFPANVSFFTEIGISFHGVIFHDTACELIHYYQQLLTDYLLKQSYNPEAYEELMEFISRHSLNDGNKFCANLMRESPRHQTLALRILEVRSAYCKRDFEWDNLKRLAFKMVDESNTKLMRDYVLETSHVENEKS